MGYTVRDALRSIKVLPGDLVYDAEMVTIQTTPTGLTATYAVPLESYLSGAGAELLNELATGLEELVSERHVIAGTATQQIDDAGFIMDTVDCTVAYTDPSTGVTLTGVVSIPVDAFFAAQTGIGGLIIPGTEGETPASLADAEYSRLRGLAGG